MFRFESPEYLYLLLIVPILATIHYWFNYRKRKRLRKYGDPDLLKGLMHDVSIWRPEVKTWLTLLSLACIIIAAARPQYGTKLDTSERNGIEAIIAIDVSNSMLAEDVRPSRLEKAKMLVSNMVDGMKDDQVGLVVFAGDAFTQLPITNDYVSAKMFLEQIDPSMIRVQGTDIATAIDLCKKSFTQREGVSRAIFVITDGEDNEGGAVAMAEEAAKKGIHVYMLGIGNPNGSHIPVPGTTQNMVDNEGNEVVTRLNEGMCREIAKAGKGAYIYVDNSSSAQKELAKYVDKLAKTKLESNIYSEYDEQYQGFLILAVVLLLLDILLLERKNHLFKSFHLFKRSLSILILVSIPIFVNAQSHRDYIRRGNRQFRDSVYNKAQVEYQKGFQKDSDCVQVLYNLSNTMLRQGNPKEAMRLLEKAAKLEHNSRRRSMIYHNMGVILQSQKQFQQAIECYKESLRHNPSDDETRYNLVLCQRQLKNQKQDDQKQNNKQDQKEKQDQDKDKQQKEQEKKEEEKENREKDNPQQQPNKNDMTKENAEQMLKAALQNERNTQQKVKQQQQQSRQRRLEKQW